ncbi:ESX-5 secretion system protein EccD5 [Mycobacterium talmoniae]|uniref:ESX-5 secretion system protein EccD5 n=1 Tax=Mycobacterium talmoniae TaxID=1858794 RepID=A0A2S8BF59_9MYCO|nr:type VII secretion integral membrane protein EccD [Mycobacterium eburneum]PQM45303.1 ESX-5 secretion system protein EccD5 [Mycobacterium talmoniae]TDH48465.1 type VII secretion integral membrane protein EccD [Mycobacterium eburneum]
MSDTVCEVSLRVGDWTQVDVKVPANSELGVVLGDIELYLGEYLDSVGAADKLPDASRGWRLRTPIGTLLDNQKSLAAQGVPSGAALELIAAPAGEEFAPRVEDVSAFVAGLSRKLFPAATPDVLTTVMLGFAALMAGSALTLLEVLAIRARTPIHVGVVLGCVVAVGVLALINARTRRRGDVADISAAGIIVFGPISLSLLLPRSFGDWGAPHLLVTAAGTAAAAGVLLATGRHRCLYTSITVAAAFLAVSQVASLSDVVPGPAMTCGLVVAVVIALGRADALAARLAWLPVSMFPSGSGRFIGRRVGGAGSDTLEPTEVPPDPAGLLERAVRANDYLTGILIGLSVVATVLTGLVAATHGRQWPWLAFAAGVPVLFAYRTWYFAGRRNVFCLLLGVFGPALSLTAVLSVTYGLWCGAGVATAVSVLALVAPATVPTDARPHPPLVRGARVLSEYAVIAAVLLAPMLLLRIPQMVYNRDFG